MSELLPEIVREIQESIAVKEKLAGEAPELIADAAQMIITSMQSGGKLIVFGNGGSAADAQHFSAELVGRYRQDRKALPAIALTTDSSALTSIGNDYGFDTVFSRQLEAIGKPGDVALAISTSGNSPNVLGAVSLAKKWASLPSPSQEIPVANCAPTSISVSPFRPTRLRESRNRIH